jgi:tRNA(Ile)-lysidine synthase TilS/MesJ
MAVIAVAHHRDDSVETFLLNLWGIKRSDLFVGRANDVKRFAVQ